ncbi:probable membrane-associated kinase regulator 2 [Diospyros lotus]|uniref:probable membrane-associated kinase regulator 2 n=1 Tax=Diospyros lotus TaxID=55363 RepID=UPI00225261A9|nr:probable membrane-associated kinase regulator 2 [Diospyros lotus]
MEVFSLLKFWAMAAGDELNHDDEIQDEDSFFDLEFAVPGCDEKEQSDSALDVDFELSSKPPSPFSFLRSPPKFRVLMLFRKPKSEKPEPAAASPELHRPSKRFDRVNSLRRLTSESASLKRFTKLIKPLHIRASNSKRYSENMKFSDGFSTTLRSPGKQAEEKQATRQGPATLIVACKHLGKSRSASSTVGIAPAPPRRRDDSLLQQHDGIQSAILHCKRSYSSSQESSGVLPPPPVNPSRSSI